MIDNKYNPQHCDGCHQKCGPYQDAFKGDRIFKSKTLFGPRVDTGKRFVIRYAQHNLMAELAVMATA